MDLTHYRNSPNEKARIGDLIGLLPATGTTALDIGARDGFISILLTDHFSAVTALDLETPVIAHERVQCVKGDITSLEFPDASFDLVLCAEVLEHIPTHLLETACNELARVSSEFLLIGTPYKQDIRVGRTTCKNCGEINPPYGHVNSFDEGRLRALFPGFAVARQSFVGQSDERTNRLSCALMDLAGNPYGTYSQEEPCIHCGADLTEPVTRKLWQKFATKLAFAGIAAQRPFLKSHGNWIHMLLRKDTA